MQARLLIVDDAAANRILLKSTLVAACYKTLLAESGAEGLRLARLRTPNLILIDLALPDMDGIALCRALRAAAATRTVPIVITAPAAGVVHDAGVDATRLRALAAGADDFIRRPFDDQMLLARLRCLLRAHEEEQELHLRELTGRSLGLAEPDAPFQHPARIAFVSAAPLIAQDWVDRLEPLTRHQLSTLTPAAARKGPRQPPDVFVIAPADEQPDEGLRLIADLRSRPATRHAAMCLLLPQAAPGAVAMALDLGANDALAPGFAPRELVLRLDMLQHRKQRADRLRSDLRDGARAALRDPLTGLFNRRYALPHLGRMVDRLRDGGRCFAVLVLDIDRFKAVNDTWGHGAGDMVLTEVAQRLQQNLRSVDTLARIGGEEFLILMPDTGPVQGRRAAERLRHVIESAPVTLSEGEVKVTLSIGLAIGRRGRLETPQGLIDRADRALFQAKAFGRNRVTVNLNPA